MVSWSCFFFLKASRAPATDVGGCRCYSALSSFAASGAVTVFTIKGSQWLAHHEPFLTKYPFLPPINCSQGVTFFLAAQLYADSPLALIIILWVEFESLTFRLQKLGNSHTLWIEFPVPSHGKVTLAVDTATACVLPWGLTLGFPFMLSSLKCRSPKWLLDWICWFSYLQNAAECTNKQNSLSCQRAPVRLKPVFSNVRHYSCSYFLAFLLL